VVVAGDLNLPAAVAGRLLGATPLVRAATFPAHEPKVQLDHVLSVGALRGDGGRAVRLAVGDHRALLVGLHR
jgi:endonuclease/exonuclease/phosphatase (EEP) superfamily protein YafD